MNDTASALLSVLRDGAPDALGALGLILYLGSYLALQLGLIRGDGWLFPTFILAASLSLILSLIGARFNPYSMMVEVAWATISVIGLIRLYIIYKYFRFSDQEQAAAKRLGPGLAKDRFRKLLSLGNWSDVMLPNLAFVVAYAVILVLSTAASVWAADFGTAEEAKAMLEKAVAAVKEDKAKALDMFNNGEGGFKDRDLYVWCANASDGIVTAT
jgi:hypothetical protein